jgi:hypothetical protein
LTKPPSRAIIKVQKRDTKEVIKMLVVQFEEAVAQGRMFWMQKYLGLGQWSQPQLVSAERAMAKARVVTEEGYHPYRFEIAE